MADQQSNWILELIDKITKPVKEITASVHTMETAMKGVDKNVEQMGDNATKAFDKTNKSMQAVSNQAHAQNILNLGQPFLDGAKGAYDYDASLKELSAITGVVGKDLDTIGGNARKSAVDLGGDAAESVKSYTLLLSKLTPEIAKNPEALDMMGNSVALLGETMHGDLTGAANAASSAMNQFGVDLTDPVSAAKEMDVMLNNMASSAKVGNQEVAQVAQGLDGSGASAKKANVSFIETNAALQVLGKYGKEGAEGGVALNNVLAVLGKKEFLPKEVLKQLKDAGVDVDILSDKNKSLADRISELKKLSGKDEVLGAMFGTENTIAISGLLGSVDLLKQYTTDITKDQTALADMAATMGTSYQEQRDRMVSYFDDIKLSVYGVTGSLLPFLDLGVSGIMQMVNLAPGIMSTVQLFKSLRTATIFQTIAQWNLNAAMDANPIGAVIIAIVALVAIVAVIIKYYDDWGAALTLVLGPLGLIINLIQSFRRHWDSITEAFEKDGIVGGIKRIGLVLLDALLYPVQQLLELLSKIPGLGGLAGGGAKFISEIRHNLALDEGDPKKEKKLTAVAPEGKPAKASIVPPQKPKNPTDIGKDKEGANSGGGKIINMTLTVNNIYKVVREDLKNVEKMTEHIVGKINDTLKDALIAAG
jgi:TP901 family phage tail tape measure protein